MAPPPSAAPAPTVATPIQFEFDDSFSEASASPHDALPTIVEAKPVPPRKQLQRNIDWGGTVTYPNDDSMSLASAQRMLFAVENGRGFTPDQVRPHELLNYFSFDTSTPSGNDLFQVTGSAEYTAKDELSVALAVKGATPARRPLDLTMLVDRSCSMQGEGRMDYTKRGLHAMESSLKTGDRVDLVVFDQDVCTPLENFVVGRDDPALLRKAIDGMRPRGSTDLNKGLQESYRIAKEKPNGLNRNRRVMVLTDAFLNTGDVNDTVSEIGKAFEEDNIRLTGIGVGRDFNDDVLNKLTEKGKGAFLYLGSEAVVDRVFSVGFDSLVQTIAHDVHFRLDLPQSLAMERFYGEEASSQKADVQPINYYAGTSQVFLQDLKSRNARNTDKLQLTVEYTDALTGRKSSQQFDFSVGQLLGADAHNVRKARTLMAWSDILLDKSMSGACGEEAMQRYTERVSRVSNDAEVAYISGLVEKTCGKRVPVITRPRPTPRAMLKVKVDSDIPIAEVALQCQGNKQTARLSSSDTVARFTATSGQCDITLFGTVAMTSSVNLPSTGGDVSCRVRGGRMTCS